MSSRNRTIAAPHRIRLRSAFVPHDLEQPVTGSRSGPLAGLTAAVKDMYDIAGTRTGGGNPQWLAAQTPAQVHAGAAQRILNAGATIIGKTICDEFFYSVSGDNAHYGTPANPRAPGSFPEDRRAGWRRRRPPGCATSHSAATPAVRCAFPPRTAAFMGCARRWGGSICPARWRWRPLSTLAAGSRPVRACSARLERRSCRERAMKRRSRGWSSSTTRSRTRTPS